MGFLVGHDYVHFPSANECRVYVYVQKITKQTLITKLHGTSLRDNFRCNMIMMIIIIIQSKALSDVRHIINCFL